jgi:hypothetical protein
MSSPYLYFQIDHSSENAGWICCYLTCDGMTHHIDASGAFPPFRDLLNFLRSIALNRLPAWFFWDQEGQGLYFDAWPAEKSKPGDEDIFHLRVINDVVNFKMTQEGDEFSSTIDSYQVMLVDANFKRQVVVDVFLEALRNFALYSQNPDEWDFCLADLTAFEQLCARNVPSRQDITHAEPVDITISRCQDDEAHNGNQSFELYIFGMKIMLWVLEDTDLFWAEWLALLEHMLDGQPYQMDYVDARTTKIYYEMIEDRLDPSAQDNVEWRTRICAEPLNYPRHFRLKIYETNANYRDFLKFDEVVDPIQLARAFMDTFDSMLNDGYRAYLDNNNQVFDLRLLPIDRLKRKLPESG